MGLIRVNGQNSTWGEVNVTQQKGQSGANVDFGFFLKCQTQWSSWPVPAQTGCRSLVTGRAGPVGIGDSVKQNLKHGQEENQEPTLLQSRVCDPEPC